MRWMDYDTMKYPGGVLGTNLLTHVYSICTAVFYVGAFSRMCLGNSELTA